MAPSSEIGVHLLHNQTHNRHTIVTIKIDNRGGQSEGHFISKYICAKFIPARILFTQHAAPVLISR